MVWLREGEWPGWGCVAAPWRRAAKHIVSKEEINNYIGLVIIFISTNHSQHPLMSIDTYTYVNIKVYVQNI